MLNADGAAFSASLMNKDSKTGVNQFCQRFCKRPVTKDDIVYIVQKYSGGFQATVKLNCIEGQEFAGELCPTQKDAEKSASQQVLDFYADQIAAMPKAGAASKKKKRSAGEAGLATPAAPGAPGVLATPGGGAASPANPAMSSKSELNSTCSKILRRVMEKGEVQYETVGVVGGYQSTVQMPGLPEQWGQQVWAGEVHTTRQNAEQSAAAIALDAIKADPALMAAHNAPPKPKNWSPNGGKGKSGGITKGGKGLQVNAQAANQWNAALAGMGFGFM